MNIIIDNERKKIIALKEEKVLFDMYFSADEFLFNFYTNEPVIISENYNNIFYNNLKKLMSNNYLFDNKFSNKSENKLIFLSDQYGDLNDTSKTDMMSRLIIEKKGNKYQIFAYKPFFEKNEILNRTITTIFSPSGNGNYSQNILTRMTLQDDFINILYNSYFKLQKKIIKIKS